MDPHVLESMTQFGIIQKISTGYMLLDVAVCFLLPFALKYAKPYLQEVWEWWVADGDSADFTRHIKFIKREGYYHYDPSEKNHILQAAILMYIGSKKELVEKFSAADVKIFKTAHNADSDSDSDSDCDEDYYASELSHYKISNAPAENEWITVEEGVTMKRYENVEERGRDGGSRDRTIEFVFSSNMGDGHARIENFVQKCFDYYKDMQTAKRDHSRYLYIPSQHTKGTDSESKNTLVYKRYKLSDEKTFDCYFHESKKELLYLVDHFLNKSGKFAIRGYPHKLGLLLHGPPGTGKTSLIKALAHYTNRSIVSVPLNKVKTNQELMDIMFDQSFLVQGEELPMRLPHSKVIFVMEDIDAAGSVVLRRQGNKASNGHMTFMREAFAALQKEGGDGSPSAIKHDAADGAGKDTAIGPFDLATKWTDGGDELNLAGVLNVLDGVVDCPERIVIMTSNHPDKLDPALIRPGRINKRLHLGYMTANEATEMVQHHFPEASAGALKTFRDALRLEQLTAARLEALCAEHDELPGLAAHLEKVVKAGEVAFECSGAEVGGQVAEGWDDARSSAPAGAAFRVEGFSDLHNDSHSSSSTIDGVLA